MAGEFSPITKDVAWRKKCVKLIHFFEKNMVTNFLSKFLFKFLRNSIKYIVSSTVLGVLLGKLTL